MPYPEREPSAGDLERARQSLSPAVEQLRGAIVEHERVAALRTERSRAEQDLAAARDRLQRLDGAGERVRHASQRFDAALARMYQDPAAARASLARISAELGTERAAGLLHTEPERFGMLKTVERPRALGLVVTHDDAQHAQPHRVRPPAHAS